MAAFCQSISCFSCCCILTRRNKPVSFCVQWQLIINMSKTFDAVINASLSWNFFSQMNYSFSVFKLYVSNEMSCTGMPFFGHWGTWYENSSFMNKSICTTISSRYNMHISGIHSLSIIKTYVNTSIPHKADYGILICFQVKSTKLVADKQ